MSKSEKPVEESMGEGVELLLPLDVLLSAGIHIGTKIKTNDMEPFIFRVRPDGLFVLDIKKTDERLRLVGKFIAQFDPSKVVVVSARLYGRTPVQRFCKLTGTIPIVGRFLPGLFSNPLFRHHLEPQLVIVTDPKVDKQTVKEASSGGIPVIALCDADDAFSNVDLIIPTNNKGRKALATIYWLLARQVLREKRVIPQDGDLPVKVDDFETKLAESQNEGEQQGEDQVST